MRLFIVLLIITMHLCVSANAQRVSLNKKNTTLNNLIKELKKQSGYNFLFDANAIQHTPAIDISVTNVSLRDALDKCLAETGLSYVIRDKNVIISKASARSLQQQVLTGKITNEQGEALSGVTIRLIGTQSRTISDTKGNFKIPVFGEQPVLVFSFIGYNTREVAVNGKTIINVQLIETQTKLDEVVVLGYGAEVSKKDFTGSVGQVNMEDLNEAPVMSFDQALAGRIAGVQVSSNEGQPGEEGFNIIIRGANSLTQDVSPLYVIDGFPIEDFDPGSIRTDDIESIDVLKDASASAIYGARGANGVIVIQTKKGKIGDPVISYSGSVGFQEITKRMEMMSPYEFVKYQLERSELSSQRVYTRGDLPITDALYEADGKTLESYKGIEGINWQDRLFRLGNTQNHNLSIRGGTAKTKYALSASVYDQKGVIINSGTSRSQGRGSIDQALSKKVNLRVNLNYSTRKSNGQVASATQISGQSSSSLMYGAWAYRPVTGREVELSEEDEDIIDELKDEEITNIYDYRVNPIVSAMNTIRNNKTVSLNVNAQLDYKITKDLKLNITAGLDNRNINQDAFYNSKTARGTSLFRINDNGMQSNISLFERGVWSNSGVLSYKKKINKKHSVDILGGYELQAIDNSRYSLATKLIPYEELGVGGMDEGTPLKNTVRFSRTTLGSLFGRANYNYLSKYFLTATFRADASSKFSAENRTAYFPSGAFAWRMGKENFMKGLSFVSDAKLRISYGLTGNNRVSDFPFLTPIGATSITESYSFDNSIPTLGMYPSALGNENLKWETTSQLDLGYDISFLKNRIDLSIDAYQKITDDLLLNANVPSSMGFLKAYKNIGKIKNEGLEVTLNTYNIKSKNFDWQSNFNISFNRNKILALTHDETRMFSRINWAANYNASSLYVAEVNGPAAVFMGYVFDGLYQYEDFDKSNQGTYSLKANLPYYGTNRDNIQPGDIKYKDMNEDGIIDEYDEAIIGNPQPLHTGGFSNRVRYKAFSLNVLFQWSYGNDIFNGNRLYFEGNTGNLAHMNQYSSYQDRWTPENPSNTLFRSGGQGPAYYSSRVIEDGSFLRLKTISLSYNVPKMFLNSLKISKLSLSATAQNLYTWTNYSGVDPEVSVRNSILTPGFDFSAYPRAKTIVFTLRATL